MDTVIDHAQLEVHNELEAVREFHDAQALEQGITISCTGRASLDAEPLLLRRAISNLVSNALSHTPRGGRIRLEARQADRWQGGNYRLRYRLRHQGGGSSAHIRSLLPQQTQPPAARGERRSRSRHRQVHHDAAWRDRQRRKCRGQGHQDRTGISLRTALAQKTHGCR